MSNRTRMGILIAAGLLLAAAAFSQQVKRTQTAEISADELEFAWDTSIFEFKGNCRLKVGGDYDATMTAPVMTVTIADKPAKVKSLVASGPVNFIVITRPDSAGLKRKITASAKEQAVYSEETQTIKLVGEAQADMVPMGAADDVEALHFTGQSITANLKTARLKVDDANLTIKTRLP